MHVDQQLRRAVAYLALGHGVSDEQLEKLKAGARSSRASGRAWQEDYGGRQRQSPLGALRLGQLFKAGHQNSRWAQQVQEYACLYTSHVTNFLFSMPTSGCSRI